MTLKKPLLLLLCLIAVFAFMPTTALAAGEYVTINGAALGNTTPYYFTTGNRITNDPENGSWNAYLQYDSSADAYTLHLKIWVSPRIKIQPSTPISLPFTSS